MSEHQQNLISALLDATRAHLEKRTADGWTLAEWDAERREAATPMVVGSAVFIASREIWRQYQPVTQ